MMKKFQKELSNIPNPESGLNEYEENFLPTPSNGPLTSDPIYDSVYNFDFFTPKLINKAREDFKECLEAADVDIKDNELELLESYIDDYVASSTKPSGEKTALYNSILDSYGDILLERYNLSDDETKQNIPASYFEKYNKQSNASRKKYPVISEITLKTYCHVAQEITKHYLELWAEDSVKKNKNPILTETYDGIHLHRGINNRKYYTDKSKRTGDFLSIYTGLFNEGTHSFFERSLLTSYTISPNLADQFAVGFTNEKSERRCFIITSLPDNESRIFSSFLTSKSFDVGQYEILCLPSTVDLIIRQPKSDDIESMYEIHSIIHHH